MNEEIRKKIYITGLLFIIIIVIFIIKLFTLQIVSNYKYILRSISNIENKVEIKPLRGEILDRNGIKLVENKPVFNIYFVKQKDTSRRLQEEIFLLSKILDISYKKFYKKIQNIGMYNEVLLKSNIEFDTLSYILSNYDKFPDIRWKESYIRHYTYNEAFFHLIGYVGEINRKELTLLHLKNYEVGDIIGKMGIEKKYDSILRGIKGEKILKNNAKGQLINEIILKNPIPGKTLKLTIDRYLQYAAYQLIKDFRGSVVIQNIKTGEILALVSSPSVDPNLFSEGLSKELFLKLLNNPSNPFLFRPISAEYPASSIFKLLMTIAGLKEGVINLKEKILCKGQLELGDRVFKCTERHGYENLLDAIRDSCNVYFYNVGLRLGIRNIDKYAKELGFGSKTGIDIPNENSGFVPTPEWKINKLHEPWYDGDTLNVSIGQGYLLVTVLQINELTSLIANRGHNFIPHVIKEIIDSNTKKTISFVKPELKTNVFFEPDIWDTLIKGMIAVVNEGTAKIGGVTTAVKIAGKTGTAENFGEDHSWFTAFGPVDNPEIAITVMIENGGYGASVAAPIVATLFEIIYGNKSLEKAKRDLEKARYKKYIQLLKEGKIGHHH